MLACLRTEEIASKPFLQAFLGGRRNAVRTALLLEPMTEDETWDVMASMIPAEARITTAERLALAREAGGNPFLLEQLAHYAAVHDAGGSRSTTLADMLQHRLQDSPDGARRFLEVLAVCGRPMAPQVVYEAAGLAGDERPLVAILRSDHLLRHSGSASRIEMYHDRMRETLAAQLSPEETRGIHGLLVRTLTARGSDDPEALFEHCRGAGDRTARRGRRRGRRPRRTPCSRSTGPRSSIATPSSWCRTRPGRHRVEARPGGGADQCRPTAGGGARLSRGRDGRRRLAAGRASASRRRTVPRRRSHRRGPGRHPHGPPPSAHAAGAEPAGGARLAGLAARPDPLARTRVRGTRPGSHSGGPSAADRYLLVRGHRSRAGRQHSCRGFQHPPSAAGARGRRTVPARRAPWRWRPGS